MNQLGISRELASLASARAVLAEFFATFLFVLVGAGTVVSIVGVLGLSPAKDAAALVGIALAHGLAIALLVTATANLSGGHINPAVTFGAIITGRMKLGQGLLYMAAQLVGAVLAALALQYIFVDAAEGNLGAHALGPGVAGEAQGFLAEVLLTFLLVGVVFATAMDPRGRGNLAPIAIGLAVLVDHLVGVPLTGASMNPARSFGPAAIANAWDSHWIYWAGPLVGGGLAALIYYYIYMWREKGAGG